MSASLSLTSTGSCSSIRTISVLLSGRRRRHAAGFAVRSFFGVDGELPQCKIGWVRVPGGAILEIFEFQPRLPPAAIPWNRVGLTYFSFNVRDTQRWYEYLVIRGVECVSRPERSPRGHTLFFARDFDGNLVEMIDLGYMQSTVLKFFGPLGGWIFRKAMAEAVTTAPEPSRPTLPTGWSGYAAARPCGRPPARHRRFSRPGCRP